MKNSKIPKYTGPETRQRTNKMSREEIKARFDHETASAYSNREVRWLPEFRTMFGLVPRILRPLLTGESRILDLGAGTGNLSRTVLESIPEIHCTLMDFSPNMLAEVPKVLAAFPGKFDVIEADFSKAELGRGLYKAVISSFAIHHMRGDDEYLGLYKRIRESLVNEGIFLCCDVVSGALPYLSAINEHDWASFLRDQKFTENDIERILSNYKIEDSPASVDAHMRLLRNAGFDVTDVIWKHANFAVYIGIRGRL